MFNARVFISYSSKDREFCERFANALKESNLDVWYFDHDNPYGSTISQTIAPELLKRRVFIILLSKAALKSRYVFNEFDVTFTYLTEEGESERLEPRLILPITLERLQQDEFNDKGWPFLKPYTRIEGPNGMPLPFDEMIEKTVSAISHVHNMAQPPLPSPEFELQPIESIPNAATHSVFEQSSPFYAQDSSLNLNEALDMAPIVTPKRIPVYLLLDTSPSMKGAPIVAVNNGVRTLYNELISNLRDRGAISVSVITFSYRVEFAPLTPLSTFIPPLVTTNNLFGEEGTLLGGALEVLRDELAKLRNDEQAYVFLLTDGEPTDGGHWRRYSLEINHVYSARIGGFFGVGCGAQADLDILKQICREVLFVREFSPQMIREAFNLLFRRVKDATLSLPPSPFLLPPGIEQVE